MRKSILLGSVLLVVVACIAYLYFQNTNSPDNSFTYRTERFDQPSTSVNGTSVYVIDGRTYAEEDLRREIFEASATNGSVSFRRVFLETACNGEYKAILTKQENVFSVNASYSGGSCDRYAARLIEGTISGIRPGRYVLKAAGMTREFEIK